MKMITFIFAILILLGASFTPEKSASFRKKADKNLARIFMGKQIEKKSVDADEKYIAESRFKNIEIFLLMSAKDSVGYLVFTSSMGRYESFDYMIVYNPEMTVKEIVILNYTSSHGGEVASQKWLKQFIGYEGKHLKYGSDIDAISGATYSATSLVKDVESITIFMKKKFKPLV